MVFTHLLPNVDLCDNAATGLCECEGIVRPWLAFLMTTFFKLFRRWVCLHWSNTFFIDDERKLNHSLNSWLNWHLNYSFWPQNFLSFFQRCDSHLQVAGWTAQVTDSLSFTEWNTMELSNEILNSSPTLLLLLKFELFLVPGILAPGSLLYCHKWAVHWCSVELSVPMMLHQSCTL